MEDWKALYASKLTTADEAVRQIPNGSRVFFGHAANEPPVLVDALVRNYEQYKDVEIVHWVPMGKGEYCDPKMKGHLRHNAMFVGGPTRKAVQEGRADYTPFFFHQSTRFFSDGTFPIDVAMVSVTPPDKHGYVSLGVSVGGTKPACLNAKMVIAQVNDQMPRTMGESFLHVSQLTCQFKFAFARHHINFDLQRITTYAGPCQPTHDTDLILFIDPVHMKPFFAEILFQLVFIHIHRLTGSFVNLSGCFSADFAYFTLQVTHTCFSCIPADDLMHRLIGNCQLFRLQSIFFNLLAKQMFLCDMHLFVFRIAGYLDQFHTIQ